MVKKGKSLEALLKLGPKAKALYVAECYAIRAMEDVETTGPALPEKVEDAIIASLTTAKAKEIYNKIVDAEHAVRIKGHLVEGGVQRLEKCLANIAKVHNAIVSNRQTEIAINAMLPDMKTPEAKEWALKVGASYCDILWEEEGTKVKITPRADTLLILKDFRKTAIFLIRVLKGQFAATRDYMEQTGFKIKPYLSAIQSGEKQIRAGWDLELVEFFGQFEETPVYEDIKPFRLVYERTLAELQEGVE